MLLSTLSIGASEEGSTLRHFVLVLKSSKGNLVRSVRAPEWLWLAMVRLGLMDRMLLKVSIHSGIFGKSSLAMCTRKVQSMVGWEEEGALL